MWDQARHSAHAAVVLAAKAECDFEFAPAAFNLVFLLASGPADASFDLTEVQRLIEDGEAAEARLEEWDMREHAMFDCSPKRWLPALRHEWERKQERRASDAPGEKRVTLQRARKERADKLSGRASVEPAEAAPAELPAGHMPVTDWRVWDQRFFGFYTWLEPPMQSEPQKCVMCGAVCLKVHRCAPAAMSLAVICLGRAL